MKPFHGPNQVHDAEKSAIELLVARCHSSVDFHALKQVLHQMACPVPQSIKLKLTPFHGHFIVPQEGVRDAQTAYA